MAGEDQNNKLFRTNLSLIASHLSNSA